MAKLLYRSPILRDLEPHETEIPLPPSQGTSGDDPVYKGDPTIDAADVTMFWASYDETDLPGIDTDHDLYISYAEFYAWYNEEKPW